jgi:hypothetical protein
VRLVEDEAAANQILSEYFSGPVPVLITQNFPFSLIYWSRDGSVCIVTGYELECREFDSSQKKRIFFFLFQSVQIGCGAHPTSDTIGVSRRVGAEVDHSPPSSVKVKNGGPIPPPPRRLHNV